MSPGSPSTTRTPDAKEASDPVLRTCDLCGSSETQPILTSGNLDGPLVRCVACGFHYVSARAAQLAFGQESSSLTAKRIRDANVNFVPLGREEERRLNELNARWRLDLIRGIQGGGRLLEVGCGRGEFLKVARGWFDACGVEPNPELAADARREASIYQGLIEDTPWSDFDVAASFHVIEHVDSPSKFVEEIARRLRPGGLVALETPDIGSWPYRLMKARWRQFIPEHYYFFDRKTLHRLLSDNGFEVRQITRVGKYASLSLLLNRLGRYVPLPVGDPRRFAGSFAFRLNPLDILLALAIKK